MFKSTSILLFRTNQRLTRSINDKLYINQLKAVSAQPKRFFSEEKKSESEQSEAKSDATTQDAEATKHLEKIKALEQEVKDLKDKVLRAYADEENVRRIAKRDVDNAKAYANTSFAKALLDVADNLDYALNAIENEKHDNHSPIIKNLISGVKMTNEGLSKVFGQFGISKYAAVGDKFDPTIHDALFQIPDANKPEGTVGQVLKHGYKMKDRVIRAAQVGAVSKPSA